MKNYESPIVKLFLCKEQDVVRTSSGFATFGTDNGVFYPGISDEKAEGGTWQ